MYIVLRAQHGVRDCKDAYITYRQLRKINA